MNYKVVAVSSQDAVYCAENVMNKELIRTWQTTSNDGNTKGIIELEFYKPTVIKNIEIGNAGSAFVEVLAGNSDQEPEDFVSVVTITGFMSPSESKSNTNKSRVKNLTDKISAQAKDKKFERVRVVCTQPYTTTPFGLSLININNALGDAKSSDEKEEPAKKPTFDIKKLERQGSGSKKSGYLFFEKKEPQISSQESAPVVPAYLVTPPNLKNPTQTTKEEKKPPTATPFHKIMEDVVFVLSGFQGQQRQTLRDMMGAMGGKYEANWTDDATHLIAAFAGTPKIKEMQKSGHGVAVAPAWIEECHKQKKRISEKEYMLLSDQEVPKQKRKNEEPEEQQSVKKPKADSGSGTDPMNEDELKKIKQAPKPVAKPAKSGSGSDTDPMNEAELKKALPTQSPKKHIQKTTQKEDSGSDTDPMNEQELRKVMKTQPKVTPKPVAKPAKSGSGSDTDPMADTDIKAALQKTTPKKPVQKSGSGSDTDPMNEAELKKLVAKSTTKKPSGSGNDTDPMEESDIKAALAKSPQNKAQAKTGSGSDTDKMDEVEIKKSMAQTTTKKSLVSSEDTVPMEDQKDVTPKKPSAAKPKVDDKSSKDYAVEALPNNFFNGVEVLLHNLPKDLKKTLTRLIYANGGEIGERFDRTTTHIIATDWDTKFEDALENNPKIMFVKPDWIVKCHEAGKLLPIFKFIVQAK